jgi:hypothetical protein
VTSEAQAHQFRDELASCETVVFNRCVVVLPGGASSGWCACAPLVTPYEFIAYEFAALSRLKRFPLGGEPGKLSESFYEELNYACLDCLSWSSV